MTLSRFSLMSGWVAMDRESDMRLLEAMPHSGLMSAIEERVCDSKLLKLLRAMLRAGSSVMARCT